MDQRDGAQDSDLRDVTSGNIFTPARWTSLAMEVPMTRFQEKAQGITKRTVGQMIGDDRLVLEGEEQEQRAEKKEAADDKHADNRKH